MVEGETKGSMRLRHRNELKAVQAEAQKMLKDKKRDKREAKREAAALKADTEARHAKELEELESGVASVTVDEIAPASAEETTDKTNKTNEKPKEESETQTAQPLSRAEKRRRKKQEQERQRQAEIEKLTAEFDNSKQEDENATLQAHMTAAGLAIVPIPSDGHCLFASLAYQLPGQTVASLRALAADTIVDNKDMYMAFIVPIHDGRDPEELFAAYIHRIRSTAEWGGEVELAALARGLGVMIEVFSARQDVRQFGEGEVVRVSYHEHQFTLGQHYNAVIPRPQASEE